MYIDSAGLVGIGTTSPSSKLDVLGADAVSVSKFKAATALMRFRPYVDATIGSAIEATNIPESAYSPLTLTGSVVRVTTNTGAVTTFDASGQVGIGTASPGYKLQVNGTMAGVVASGANYSAIRTSDFYYMTVSADGLNTLTDANGSAPMLFKTGGSERARITSGGLFGIGTTSPSTILDATQASSGYWNGSAWTGTPSAVTVTNTNFGGYDPVFIGRMTDGGGTSKNAFAIGAVGTSSWTAGDNASQTADVYFAVRNNAGGITERMRITTLGNVGIGTGSPTTISGYTALEINNATNGAILDLAQADTMRGRLVATSASFSLETSGSIPLIFAPTGTERMRITSAGGLAVGTTTDPGAGNIGLAAGKYLQYSSTAYMTPEDNVAGARIVTPGAFNLATGGTAVRMTVGSDGTTTLNVGGVSSTHQFNYNESGGEIQLIDSTGAGPILLDNVSGLARLYKVGTGAMSIGTTGANYLQFITNGSESMRISSAGNVGIGTSSPGTKLDVQGTVAGNFFQNLYNDSSNAAAQTLYLAKSFGASGVQFGQTRSSANGFVNLLDAAALTFGTNNTERMRIDASGHLLVGKSGLTNETTTDGFIYYKNASGGGSTLYATNGGNGTAMALSVQADTNAIQFFRSGTLVGSVSLTSSNTAYNTSSDYRLKEIDGPIANSGAYIDALKPVQGSWKADGSRFIGLLAHEVQEVSETPIATGEKDGEEMQAMDYSAPELIANLIAEIQSLRARVAQLEGN
jgi:hypothetical protein